MIGKHFYSHYIGWIQIQKNIPFAHSKPNTVYRAVFDNAMDDLSFNEPYKSMKRTVENSNHAYYGEVYSFKSYQDMACEVIILRGHP